MEMENAIKNLARYTYRPPSATVDCSITETEVPRNKDYAATVYQTLTFRRNQVHECSAAYPAKASPVWRFSGT